MALTEEQIKNLKYGDPIIIHGTFERMFDDGDIVGRIKNTDLHGKVTNNSAFILPSCVSLPEETMKHDICCEFKKGDIVREVSWNGIEPSGLGNIYEVEANDGTVIMLRNNPCNIALAPCFLELVYSKDKESTCDVIHEVLEESINGRFEVVVDNMDSYSHKIKDTHTSRLVATFPYCDPPFESEITDRAEALKKATEYCKYLNNTYESEQERQKL